VADLGAGVEAGGEPEARDQNCRSRWKRAESVKGLDPQRRDGEDRNRRRDLCGDGGRGAAGLRTGEELADGAKVLFVLRGAAGGWFMP
jgi:hypothetical protein